MGVQFLKVKADDKTYTKPSPDFILK